METLTLDCWVYGEDVERIFPVEISRTDNVACLREAIKEKLGVDVDPRDLDLYAISLPGDKLLKYVLGQWTLSSNQSLGPRSELSKLFPQSDEGQWLIIVNVPSFESRTTKPCSVVPNMSLNCWIHGEDVQRIFTVEISGTETVATLKKAIKDKISYVNSCYLDLYAISLPYDKGLQETLKGLMFAREEVLTPVTPLSDVFSDAPLQEYVHIVIKPQRPKHALEEADIVLKAKRSKLATIPPSIIATPIQYREMQANPDQRLLDGRHILAPNSQPDTKSFIQDADIPPISLMYEGFGQFLDIYRGRKDVPGMEKVRSPELRSAVDVFAEKMTFIYANEDERRLAGLAALDDIFSARTDGDGPATLMAAVIGDKYRSDAHVIGRQGATYCVLGFRNESGHTSAIPYVEMNSYFAHLINQAWSSFPEVIRGWRAPSLGITIVGPCVTFYAVMAFGQYRVVSLTPGLSCIRASGDGDDRRALHAAFTAASVLVARIKADAERLATDPPSPIKIEDRFFPPISKLLRPHSYHIYIQLNIIHLLDARPPSRYLYIAQKTDGEFIIVKFTRSYSLELHTFCADRGHAPAVLGFQRLPGGFFAIAMEWVQSAEPLSRSLHGQKHEEWAKQLQDLVQSFHAKDLVHGDLRSPNIICDGTKVMLIDFDWGGKVGEASYPSVQLNPELTDGRGSTDLKITRDDDLRVLRRTLDMIKPSSVYVLAI